MSSGKGRKKDPKVKALQAALKARDPFYSGICPLPDYQRFVYYKHEGLVRCIDFSNAGSNDLDALYRACEPAEFGRGGENVTDESYRKAGKMDLVSFATLFDPRSLGIHEQASKALLTEGNAEMDLQLYKLNVYGQGDFFKAHKDTPRGQDMFGSLVVVLPTQHEGGQLVLRQTDMEKEWTLDFADELGSATEPSVCFVAFYSDVEHEVLSVTSGYRVTLTYNLYRKPVHPSTSPIPTPFHQRLERTLTDLVNDKSMLPNGGYLGFGLAHEYVHTGSNLIEPLMGQLKGSDRALADTCDILGLHYSLKLLYRKMLYAPLNLITSKELDVKGMLDPEASPTDYIRQAIKTLPLPVTIDEVEAIAFVGQGYSPSDVLHDDEDILRPYCRDPMTEVMEITPTKSSVQVKSPVMTYGNEAELDFFYGTACMLIAVEPAGSRNSVGM